MPNQPREIDIAVFPECRTHLACSGKGAAVCSKPPATRSDMERKPDSVRLLARLSHVRPLCVVEIPRVGWNLTIPQLPSGGFGGAGVAG
jgi:hypothetical protein